MDWGAIAGEWVDGYVGDPGAAIGWGTEGFAGPDWGEGKEGATMIESGTRSYPPAPDPVGTILLTSTK